MVKYTRSLLNSMLHSLRQAAAEGSARLNEEFHNDLAWFRAFTKQALVPFPLVPSQRPQFRVEVDSSLSGGGAICSGKAIIFDYDDQMLVQAAAHPCTPSLCHNCHPHLIPPNSITGSRAYSTTYDNATLTAATVTSAAGEAKPCISILELANATAALLYFADTFRGNRVLLCCDNSSSVQVLTTGRANSPQMARLVRKAWLVCAINAIDLTASHVPGTSMIRPDALSRLGRAPAYDKIVEELISQGVEVMYPEPSIIAQCF